MKKLFQALALLLALATPAAAQVTVPNTLVAGAVIKASDLNTNFSTLGNHILDRLAGGTIAGATTISVGSLTVSAGDLTLTAPSTGITVDGVNIINSVGKIPAISSTYFASLSGTNLTGVALLGTANTFTARNDLFTYTETKTAPAISGATLTLDLSASTHFAVSFTADITTLTISNPPASGKAGSFTLALTANGVAHTVTWPASVHWAGGFAPTITSTAGKVDIFEFLSYDGGTTWFAFIAGQGF